MKPPADRIEDLPRLIRWRKELWDNIHRQGEETAKLTARIQRIYDRDFKEARRNG